MNACLMTLKAFFDNADRVFIVSELRTLINSRHNADYSYMRIKRYAEYLESHGFLARVGSHGFQLSRKLCKSSYDHYRSILQSYI